MRRARDPESELGGDGQPWDDVPAEPGSSPGKRAPAGAEDTCCSGGTHFFFLNLPEWAPLEVADLGWRASPSRLTLDLRWGHSRVAGCSGVASILPGYWVRSPSLDSGCPWTFQTPRAFSQTVAGSSRAVWSKQEIEAAVGWTEEGH